jgi:hypothetical protein
VFKEAAQGLAKQRRRDGAYPWGLMQDAAAPERYIEYFLVESWIEHERQYTRVTRADAEIQGEIFALAKPGTAPRTTRWLAD